MGAIEQEREMLRGAAKKLAEKVIAPAAEKIDQEAEFPQDIVGAMGAQGLLAIMLPEDYGGMEGDIPSLCYVAEEIGKIIDQIKTAIIFVGNNIFQNIVSGLSRSSRCTDNRYTFRIEKLIERIGHSVSFPNRLNPDNRCRFVNCRFRKC